MSRRRRLLLIGLPILLLLAGGGVAAAMIVQHNNQVAARKRAAAHAAAVQHRQQQAAQRARRAANQAERSFKNDLARSERTAIVGSLQSAVKKDAEKDVSDGVLNGPILQVQCQPASATDANAAIATYTCIAANSVSGGQLSGYRFTATINTSTGSYSWHLGG